MELLFQHSRSQNTTMKSIHQELIDHLQQASEINKWNVTKVALDFVKAKTVNMNESVELKRDSFGDPLGYDDEWKYVIHMMKFYTSILNYPKDIGHFLIKSLNVFMHEYWNSDDCPSLNEYMDGLQKLFTIPEHNISLPNIAHMYSIVNYMELSRNSLPNFDKELWEPPASLMGNKISFVSCFKEIAGNKLNFKDRFTFVEESSSQKFFHESPCRALDKYPQCKEYCNWHWNLINGMKREEFLTIMSYALPQRTMATLTSNQQYEKNLAKKLFGPNNLKNLNKKLAPISLALYCHIKDGGYLGKDLGTSVNICDDFIAIPTDIGLCLSRNFNTSTNEVIHTSKQHDTISNKTNQKSVAKWSDTTLVIFTDAINSMRQTYPRKPSALVENVKLQIHQPEEFAKMNLGVISDLDDSIDLKAGFEYFIKVIPTGQISTKSFKTMDLEQRKCNLKHEGLDLSNFKTYSENNCRYECNVRIAKNKCQCTPWDFIDDTVGLECDIFGRTCFYNVMENLTQYPVTECNHCIKECDTVEYNKIITLQESLIKTEAWYEVKGKYASYHKSKGVNKQSTNALIKDFIIDENNTFVDESLKMFWNSIVYDEPDKYESRRFDMYKDLIIIHLRFMKPEFDLIDVKHTTLDKFANFGGNFGIFAEMTGVSFLGILNLFIILLKTLYSSIKCQ